MNKVTFGVNKTWMFVATVSLVALALFYSLFVAYAAPSTTVTAGPTSPTSIVSDASAGGVSWNNPLNATSTNNIVATTASQLNNGNPTSTMLRATGFNFSTIPNTATITGVTATVVRKGSASNNGQTLFNKDLTVQLVTGTATSSNKATTSPWPAVHTTATYGSSGSFWGTSFFSSLTPTLVKSANFGLVFSVQHTGTSSSNPEVDSILLSITYTLPPDTTPPVISGTPANMTVEAVGASGRAVSYTNPTASDAVDGTVSVSCTPISGSTFSVGATTVTCSASDTAGNTASTSFIISVQDTTPPVVSVTPASQTIEATGPLGASASFTSSAVDLVGGVRPTSCTPASGSTFAIGTTTVTCTAVDLQSNTGSTTATIIVADTTGPAVTIAGDTNVSLNTSDTYTELGATANDVVDGDIVPAIGGDTVDTSVVKVYRVTYEATDSRGNKTTATRTVSVSDIDAPVIESHKNVTAEATSSTGATVPYTNPTANDAVDGTVDVTCSPESGSLFSLGTTPVTCTATDSSDNTATSGFDVIVSDTTAPTLVITPARQILEAASSTGAIASYIVSAIDIVDGDISLGAVCSMASGSYFSVGTTTIACSSTDLRNNTSSSTATVIVVDTTAPSVTPPLDQTFVATGATTTPAIVPATAVDIVDPAPVVTYDIHNFVVGTTTVTWTAKDSTGNISTTTSRVIITESPAPIITNETAGTPTETSMKITWMTDHGATSRVVYDTVSHPEIGGAPNYGYAHSTSEDVTLVTSHSVVVQGLTPGTTYYFRTVSHGSPEATSREFSGTTSTTSVPPTPSFAGGGGGAPSGQLSFGYQNGSTTTSQVTYSETQNLNSNSAESIPGKLAFGTLVTNKKSDLIGTGNTDNGDKDSQGTSTSSANNVDSNNNQAAAVGLSTNEQDVPNWVKLLLLSLFIIGGWYWFALYRRRTE